MIFPDSLQTERATKMRQLLQETDLTKQASSKGLLHKRLAHTFTETVVTQPSESPVEVAHQAIGGDVGSPKEMVQLDQVPVASTLQQRLKEESYRPEVVKKMPD